MGKRKNKSCDVDIEVLQKKFKALQDQMCSLKNQEVEVMTVQAQIHNDGENCGTVEELQQSQELREEDQGSIVVEQFEEIKDSVSITSDLENSVIEGK